jgi:hypothetical protein
MIPTSEETTETMPPPEATIDATSNLIPDDRAAASIGMTTIGLRYECRVNRRVRSVGQELGRLLFADDELRRFKKETMPTIRAEQKPARREAAATEPPVLRRRGVMPVPRNTARGMPRPRVYRPASGFNSPAHTGAGFTNGDQF